MTATEEALPDWVKDYLQSDLELTQISLIVTNLGDSQKINESQYLYQNHNSRNTSLAARGALAHRLQRRIACSVTRISNS